MSKRCPRTYKAGRHGNYCDIGGFVSALCCGMQRALHCPADTFASAFVPRQMRLVFNEGRAFCMLSRQQHLSVSCKALKPTSHVDIPFSNARACIHQLQGTAPAEGHLFCRCTNAGPHLQRIHRATLRWREKKRERNKTAGTNAASTQAAAAVGRGGSGAWRCRVWQRRRVAASGSKVVSSM